MNNTTFGAMCTIAWTELVAAMRADGHTVSDKSGPKTREWIVRMVEDACKPACTLPDGWKATRDGDRINLNLDGLVVTFSSDEPELAWSLMYTALDHLLTQAALNLEPPTDGR